MKKIICIMMVGLPGVGKSTIIKAIVEKHQDFEVLSTDSFIEDYAKENGLNYSEAFIKMGDKADGLMKQKLQKILTEKKSFLWDQTNVYSTARKKKLDVLKKQGYECIAIAVELSEEEHKKRIDQRKGETGKVVGTKIVENMRQAYTRPQKEEGFQNVILVNDGHANVLDSIKIGLVGGI